ncbi:helical backbone metal receptor [Belliella sp. R4-6]|uniref:Helical backbone metal receptor n=1 Tax=Belliella alkalica TaxID=1730871 RepID=A0ABS9VB39_9BACT|nr:helical backbone metal receptor [Belliella alkalica]MCH7413280.1 helical backbone metal receptor [Belliella alkalica]
MPIFTDQLKRKVTISESPKRIISLVPSQTELLVDLGLGDRIVGVTKFCVHPEGFKEKKQIIGGTKNFHFDKIDQLKPDLIIGNKEENYQEGIEKLAEKYPVWMSDIFDLSDAMEMMLGIGEITGRSEAAQQLVDMIQKDMDYVPKKKGTSVYLIWKDPIMVAGKNTFIDDMLDRAGYENLVSASRYPELSLKELTEMNADFLLLSSEPYPFKQKHLDEFSAILPDSTIQLVDGEIFSWYGSRLKYFKNYISKI